MSKVSTKPPSGMRDFLPSDLARRGYVTGVVREVYESYGFVPLETPSLENLDILLGKYGEDEKLVYRVLHRGETLRKVLATAAEQGTAPTVGQLADQALRYDLTVPLARVVAQYGDLPRFFKRYQIQPVWRADRPGKGRFREFYQCDVDIVGTESLVAEAEVCGAVAEVLTRLGFSDYVIKLNHRGLLRGVIRDCGIGSELESTALVAVDKLDKIGRDAVVAELSQRGVDADAAARLLDAIVTPEGATNDSALARLREQIRDEEARAALDQLSELLVLLQSTPAKDRVRFVPAVARGLGYYTGPIFEAMLPDLGSSVAGGGRYDELVGVFGKKKIPAVGFSLGLERILVVMDQRGMYPDLAIGPDVLLCSMNVERAAVLGVAHRLRAQGLRIEVYPESAKLGKQLQYADSPGVRAPVAGILGEDELAAGELTLKFLASGQQVRAPIDAVAQQIRDAAPTGKDRPNE